MSALNKKSFLTYLKEGGIYVVLLVLLAIIIFQDPTFLSLLNLSNILTQSSVRIIIALGVTGLIVTQGTDLSAGRQVGLAAVVAATLLQSMDNANKVFPEMATMPIALVILIVCAIGAVIGLINGLIIAYLNVTPFITTLGTMIIVYGINSLYYDFVGASPISGFDSGFSTFAQGCGRCYISCYDGGHQAMEWSEKTRTPHCNTEKCVGCLLCGHVCPVGCIELGEVKFKKGEKEHPVTL